METASAHNRRLAEGEGAYILPGRRAKDEGERLKGRSSPNVEGVAWRDGIGTQRTRDW
jgi:hypothetical protein